MKIKKTIIILGIFFIFLSSCTLFQNTVKVNIIGYPALDAFSITLDKKTNITINNKKQVITKFDILPANGKLIIHDPPSELHQFDKIIIRSKGIITFTSSHGDQEYKGNFYIKKTKKGLSIINEIPITDYFASVLGSEMGELFSDETLKAQAIAVRSYYYSRKKKYVYEDYDINNADGRDMVYRGASFATKRMYNIMEETKKTILIEADGRIAMPLFHSTSAGIILKNTVLGTELSNRPENPILRYDTAPNGIPLYKDSPHQEFSLLIEKESLIKVVQQIIPISTITDVIPIYFNNTQCVDFIGFTDHDRTIHYMKAYKFISILQRNGYHDIKSIMFSIEQHGAYFRFYGRGFGHFCGMSQYSAEKLAKLGYDYTEILRFYYPHYKIKKRNTFDIFPFMNPGK